MSKKKMEQDSTLFVSALSEIMMLEAEKIIPNASTKADVIASNKKRRIDALSQATSANSSFHETAPSYSSIQVVKTTAKYSIYSVSTPLGTRALKTTVTDNPSIDDVQNLDNELKIGCQISSHTFRKSYARTTYQNKQALLLEWVDGNPLSEVTKFSISDLYDIARKIISSVLETHNNKICHLNLSCDHVLLNSDFNIKIIGFGSSSSFCTKQSHNPKLLERDLHYISPEQTGRVNRLVDFRSDFYSLGIILYRLLTGAYPFQSEDASKVIKMHVSTTTVSN